jgi:hypothetical protein
MPDGNWVDSFANYSTSTIGDVWTVPGGAIVSTHVRNGPSALRPTSLRIQYGDAPQLTDTDNLSLYAGSLYAEGYIGMAYYVEDLSGPIFGTFLSAAGGGSPDLQVFLTLNADGSITASTGSPPTVLGTTAPGIISTGAWWYIELGVICSPPPFNSGVVELHVTNLTTLVTTTVLNLSGIATALLNIGWDGLIMGGPTAPHYGYVNDLYVTSDNFLGPVQLFYFSPTAAGARSPLLSPLPDGVGWAPGSPNGNYALVNEVPPNGGSTEITFDAVGAFHDGTAADAYVYDISAMPTGTILYVTSMSDELHESNVGAGAAAGIYSQSGANPSTNDGFSNTGPRVGNPIGAYKILEITMGVNRLTSAPWLSTDFPDTQLGPWLEVPI